MENQDPPDSSSDELAKLTQRVVRLEDVVFAGSGGGGGGGGGGLVKRINEIAEDLNKLRKEIIERDKEIIKIIRLEKNLRRYKRN